MNAKDTSGHLDRQRPTPRSAWAGRILVLLLPLSSPASDRYVNVSNPTPLAPYTNWATAATVIQDAIDAASDGETVWVTNGMYDTGGTVVYGTLTNRVAIDKPIAVRSVNGPEVTMIKGSGPIGDTAVRCVFVGMNATLSGFHVTNGYTRLSGLLSGASLVDERGGGTWCETSGVVSNCILSGNFADDDGGGASGGTLVNCALSANSGLFGGGASGCLLINCSLFGNSGYNGGGAAYSALRNCRLTSNSSNNGGGAYNSTLDDCILTSNSTYWSGGGTRECTLNNCLIFNNSAGFDGGGACVCVLTNCTLAGNWAGTSGGGASGATLLNCVVYYNATGSVASNFTNSGLSYCCTTPLPPGTGNIENEPQFSDRASSDFRLLPASPCVDSGTNMPGMEGDVDLDGHPRLVNWIPDMGAYEYQGIINPDTDGDGIPNDWEGPRGLNPAVSNAPAANADGDPSTDWQEFVADTSPTNVLDYLRLLDISGQSPPDMTVSFSSSTNRFYILQYCTPLVSGVWTNVPGAGPRLGTGGLDHLQDTNAPPEAPARFYRIEATLP